MNHTFTGPIGGRCIMCQVPQGEHDKALTDPTSEAAYQWPQVDLTQHIEAVESAARAIARRVAPCRAYEQPPTGWHDFGTHVDQDVPLEFSGEGDDGLPLWERQIPAEGQE